MTSPAMTPTLNEPREAASGRPPAGDGVVSRLLTRLLFRQAEIVENRELASGLHLLTLEGPALRDLAWMPGDKIQVKLGSGMSTRTYTPIDWEAQQGRTRFIAHALTTGPGSLWVRNARPGEPVRLFGPRKSLDLSRLDTQTRVLVGDETAIGLAAAWHPTHTVFEVGDRTAAQSVTDRLDLPATLIARQQDDGHLETLADILFRLPGRDTGFVLAGRARTIQHLLKALRKNGVSTDRILTKAYWAEGKVGLD